MGLAGPLMPVIPVSRPSTELSTGGVWHMSAAVVDFDGVAVDTLPDVTITLPGGTTTSPVAERVASGGFVVDYLPAVAGRYVARWLSAYGAADFAAYVTGPTTAADMPDLDACKAYLDIDPGDTSRDGEIGNALAAESAAQRARCRVGPVYPDDLREALLRRVARNLAMRLLPVAVLRGDGEGGDTVLRSQDPEIKRLEAPHRKLVLG